MIQFDANVAPIFEAIGVVEGYTAAVETDVYADAILNRTLDELRDVFNFHFTVASISHPEQFHHVWEWGEIGTNPLFYLTKQGRGKNKAVSFNFRQSLKAVPKPDPEATGIPKENIARLRNRSIFRFKAIVMETGSQVIITPRRARVLFVPTPGAKNKNGDVVNFVFTKRAVLRNVGGDAATGSFSTFWTAWWNSEAPAIIEEKVLPKVERDLATVINNQMNAVRRGSKVKTKSFTIRGANAYETALQRRKQATEKQITYYAQNFNEKEWEDEE